jgi:hypothetical protein
LREGAGSDVPLTTFATPINPDYWHALEALGYGQLNLFLPTNPLDASLRLLDEYAEKVATYRG